MGRGESVIVHKRMSFLASLVWGVCSVIMVTVICSSGIVFYSLHIIDSTSQTLPAFVMNAGRACGGHYTAKVTDSSGTCDCPADFDGDGQVRVTDLIILLGAWGPNAGHPADLNGDGVVRVPDLIILLGAWGPCN